MSMRAPAEQPSDAARVVNVTVNGEPHQGAAEPRLLLVDFLRHQLNLHGTHIGCEQGVCGACTILMDGQLVRSCITLAIQADGAELETVEGMASPGGLHPIQQAFHENHGLQCGFCTPGFVLTVRSLLEQNADPSDEEIREYLSGNVCRCTGYAGIVDAVKDAAQRLRQNGGTP
jgi:carbon-monoxide dehydrogenase small subunit